MVIDRSFHPKPSQNLVRKCIAILCAIVIWALVNHSITVTKLFPRVTCRIVNVPPDKTIRGLMPNGILDRKINLMLTGRKDVIEQLESSDFEIVIDAAMRKGDDWVVQIGKKNLVSLNPDIDLLHNVTNVTNTEFPLKFNKLVTEKIPVYFTIPQGEPPEGYQFLDIVPQYVTQTLSGPEEDLHELAAKGLEVTFNLGLIPEADLRTVFAHEDQDEVEYVVPEDWKKVGISFLGGAKVALNDPNAKDIKILFLRHKLLPLAAPLPIRVFYPVSLRETINPTTCKILLPPSMEEQDGLMFIKKGLFVGNVSKLFLDVVRDRMEILIVLDGRAKGSLSWQVQFVDPEKLEEAYVSALLNAELVVDGNQSSSSRLEEKERYLRTRFRQYMKNIKFYVDQDKPLQLRATLKDGSLVIGDL